jgi:hypothetical protein
MCHTSSKQQESEGYGAPQWGFPLFIFANFISEIYIQKMKNKYFNKKSDNI